ncbi:unnamed protein product [Arabidopsis thaliana]|uniref:Meiosis-specific protein ASY3-like coiled-coil domain-containing protein n=1 Tax=Arabidopsis thaliana TaxID=3702 RepID=A0A5S9Y6F6_ARATH|nr:unnamed protein product [Arabidopsis thaliana]
MCCHMFCYISDFSGKTRDFSNEDTDPLSNEKLIDLGLEEREAATANLKGIRRLVLSPASLISKGIYSTQSFQMDEEEGFGRSLILRSSAQKL